MTTEKIEKIENMKESTGFRKGLEPLCARWNVHDLRKNTQNTCKTRTDTRARDEGMRREKKKRKRTRERK